MARFLPARQQAIDADNLRPLRFSPLILPAARVATFLTNRVAILRID